jgi:glycosyltransferase involved in cell wall biosynthesis
MLPENMLSPFMGKIYYNFLEKQSWRYLINFYNNVNQAIIPTETGAKIYLNRGLKTNVTPISNGVNTNIFNPKNNGNYLREKYNIPKENIVLFTGRICAEKNLDILIKSIPKVLNKIDAHFVFCGSGGSYKEKIINLSDSSNVSKNTTFVDFLDWDDYPNIYSIADIFVMPAESELQSIVTMEAISSGLPVIVVNKGAVPELACENNGLLFEPRNIEQLSENIIKILSDESLKKTMIKNSIKLAKKHSMDYVTKQFEEVCLKTISEG